jgi:hypothetical protein
MPIELGAWLSQPNSSIVSTQWGIRAQIQWARILDKATDVQFIRNGVKLEPQTVRIEYDDTVRDVQSEAGNSTLRRVMIFGVRGHPDIDDFDVNLWDTFVMNDAEYTVVSVNEHLIGQVQAYCEMVGG